MSVGAETLAIASIATSVAGGVVTMIGQGQQADAAKKTAEYQAAVARNNAIIAERAAVQKEQEGKIAEQRTRQQAARLAGRQRAVFASNGVLVDDGSALDTVLDTAAYGELDALNTRYNYAGQAYNLRVQGSNFQNDAALADYRAATSDASLAQLGTLLGTAGSVAGKWYGFKKDKVF
jgi:hypothetical protein